MQSLNHAEDHAADPDIEEEIGHDICVLEDYDRALTEVICEMGDQKGNAGRWERIDAAVDSAAVDCVIPVEKLPHIKTSPSPRSKAGKHYVAANDAEIKNIGQRRIGFKTDDNKKKSVMFQTAEVGRTLISVAKLNEVGM